MSGIAGGRHLVRDDPEHPDPGFADLYASLPDAADLEPWLGWCRRAAPPVLYLGVGTGRLAVPLARAGVELVGVDAHPGMLQRLAARLPEIELVEKRIEQLRMGRRCELVIAPAGVLAEPRQLAAAAAHSSRLVAFELVNPHWLAAGAAPGVRVLSFTEAAGGVARVEVDYPGGWTQAATIPLHWPEAVEDFLATAGLDLVLMRGAGDEPDLAASATYYVLACRRFRSAQMPSTYRRLLG